MQDRLEDSGKRKLQELVTLFYIFLSIMLFNNLIQVLDLGFNILITLNFTFQCQSPEKEQPDLGQDTFARDDILNLSLEIFSRKSTGTDSVTTKKKRSLRQILRDEFLTNGQNSMIEQSIFPENENICVRREKHEEPKSYMLEVKTWKEELEKKCRQLSSNKSEQKKEDHVHHTEENLNKNTSEAGFISPKLRPNLHSNIEKESKNRGNCDKEGHDSGGFRRPLIDKTNHADKSGGGGFRDASVNKTDISVGGVPTEDLSSGKWHCPRKRKAYVGPHLKQLGLEQWIHRAS